MLNFINPRQTVLITCSSSVVVFGKETEKDEIYVTDWHMPISIEPMRYLIAVKNSEPASKLIRDSGFFVVNFIEEKFLKNLLICAQTYGEHKDKFELSGFEKESSSTIECPRIKDALAYLECKVYDIKEEGDYVLFFSDVNNAVKNKEGKRIFHVKGNKFTTTID